MAKQLLLRVPEDLHARLAARSRSEGRPVNAIANEVLERHAAVPSPRQALRARARALGVLAEPASPGPSASAPPPDRQAALAATRGRGAILDQLLADGR
ncbi:hypothetical protein [Iamia sp.]|uniref:hypothetical protein n=1 Tax=Iamia sp. TaxID=2722710 RepID=UPI002D135DBE|nr:hypothetical protein [Iamia sp.]HXH57548.1 hypothetical protein [Iamia sp.]